MTDTESRQAPIKNGEKKPYVTPQLERFGSIQELTLGPGMQGTFDATTPPGQNKSSL